MRLYWYREWRVPRSPWSLMRIFYFVYGGGDFRVHTEPGHPKEGTIFQKVQGKICKTQGDDNVNAFHSDRSLL